MMRKRYSLRKRIIIALRDILEMSKCSYSNCPTCGSSNISGDGPWNCNSCGLLWH